MKYCVEEWDTYCLHNTFKLSYRYARSLNDVAWYAAYRKFSIPVKVFPKLVLYGKYGIERVILRQNIACGFASF